MRATVYANINRPREALAIEKAAAEFYEKQDGKNSLSRRSTPGPSTPIPCGWSEVLQKPERSRNGS